MCCQSAIPQCLTILSIKMRRTTTIGRLQIMIPSFLIPRKTEKSHHNLEEPKIRKQRTRKSLSMKTSQRLIIRISHGFQLIKLTNKRRKTIKIRIKLRADRFRMESKETVF